MAGKKKAEEKDEAVEEEVKQEKEDQSFDEPEEAKDQGPSKLPDLKEVAAMAKTMYCALKGGVKEIVANYKAKREVDAAANDQSAEEPKSKKKK